MASKFVGFWFVVRAAVVALNTPRAVDRDPRAELSFLTRPSAFWASCLFCAWRWVTFPKALFRDCTPRA